MKKLTKAEEKLRRTDPKKYRELMRQRKTSSAFKAKTSETRKGKQIKKTTTETPRDTQTKAAALAAVSMIPGAGKLASAIRALAAGERLTRGLQNRVDKFLAQKKLPKPTGTAVAKRPGTSVAVKSKPKPKLPKSGATSKAVAATLGIAGTSTPAKKPKKEAKASIPTPKRKPKPPKRATESIPAEGFDAGAMKPKAKPKAKPKDEAMSMGEYLKGAVGMRGAKGLEGAKRKVKTPFGTLTFDTSDKAFEEEVENKAGGRIKRLAGGKVRGVGQAIKGFGKATYSDKMF